MLATMNRFASCHNSRLHTIKRTACIDLKPRPILAACSRRRLQCNRAVVCCSGTPSHQRHAGSSPDDSSRPRKRQGPADAKKGVQETQGSRSGRPARASTGSNTQLDSNIDSGVGKSSNSRNKGVGSAGSSGSKVRRMNSTKGDSKDPPPPQPHAGPLGDGSKQLGGQQQAGGPRAPFQRARPTSGSSSSAKGISADDNSRGRDSRSGDSSSRDRASSSRDSSSYSSSSSYRDRSSSSSSDSDSSPQARLPKPQQPRGSKSAPPAYPAARKGSHNKLNSRQRAMQLTRAIQAPQTPQELLSLLQQHAADLDHIHISAAYTSAEKQYSRGVQSQQQSAAVQQLLRHLHQLAEQQQQQCGARGLANIIWSCGRLRYPATVTLLLPELLQSRNLQQAAPQAVSNILWAAAILGLQLSEGDVQQLVQHFVRVLQQANPQDVSNTLLAVAKLGMQLSEGDVQQLVQHLVKVLSQAKPQAVSNSLWAAATLGVQLPAGDVQQLLQHFVQVLQDANPQSVSNTLWAVAKLGVQLSKGDVQQIMDHLLQLLPKANPQDVANTLWAIATLSQTVPARQLDQLLTHLQAQLPRCKPQDVANTVWACGCMQYAPLQLLSALEQQPVLMNSLLAAAVPQGLANMAWSCGQLGYRGKVLPGVLLQQAVQLLQDTPTCSFTLQGLCNLCWCAAVLDLQQYVAQVLQLAAAGKLMCGTAVSEEWCQLYQVHLWLLDSQLPAPGQGLLGVLSPQQLQQCKDSWEQSLTDSTTAAKASDTHMSVFAAVSALPADTWQHTPVLEQRTADGTLSIDIAATAVSGVLLAIEVDGPTHFVQPKSSYNGPTLFRNRVLAARGYVVVGIPYWEWDKLRSTAHKQQYLLAKLQAAAAPGSSKRARRA